VRRELTDLFLFAVPHLDINCVGRLQKVVAG
jgi:hypothetical protein